MPKKVIKEVKEPRDKFNIVVSGAAITDVCCDNIKEVSMEIGAEIAKRGHTLVTGATTGVPYFSALGCHEAGGENIGFSPAESKIDHVRRYRLPTKPFDLMIYTGSDYAGRDITMTKAADGVVIICGRIGTLHEFTTAVECGKPIAVLERSGGISDKIKFILEDNYKVKAPIVFDKNPKTLIEKLLKLVEADNKKAHKVLSEKKSTKKKK